MEDKEGGGVLSKALQSAQGSAFALQVEHMLDDKCWLLHGTPFFRGTPQLTCHALHKVRCPKKNAAQ